MKQEKGGIRNLGAEPTTSGSQGLGSRSLNSQKASRKFTPGPWSVCDGPLHDGRFGVRAVTALYGNESRIVTIEKLYGRAGAFSGCTLTDQMEANAHLIAACPTMIAYIMRKADEGDTEAQAIVKEALNAPR